MAAVRRFLVLQALLLWQGGFLFYAAFVVPIGSEVLGRFQQGMVTRHVTHSMNAIGGVALLILAWDQWACGCRWWRWGLWCALAAMLAALVILHGRVDDQVDFSQSGGFKDYAAFYAWHRAYLYVATAQWVAGLAYIALLARQWRSPTPTA